MPTSSEVPLTSAAHICSTTFIWLVLMAMVTWSGVGLISASMWRVSSLSHLATSPSVSGAKEIEPPTCRIMSGQASRMPAISSLVKDRRLEPLPSASRPCTWSTVAPAL
ncbi:hypothetical protein D3C86_1760660 [compost metagenome]